MTAATVTAPPAAAAAAIEATPAQARAGCAGGIATSLPTPPLWLASLPPPLSSCQRNYHSFPRHFCPHQRHCHPPPPPTLTEPRPPAGGLMASAADRARDAATWRTGARGRGEGGRRQRQAHAHSRERPATRKAADTIIAAGSEESTRPWGWLPAPPPPRPSQAKRRPARRAPRPRVGRGGGGEGGKRRGRSAHMLLHTQTRTGWGWVSLPPSGGQVTAASRSARQRDQRRGRMARPGHLPRGECHGRWNGGAGMDSSGDSSPLCARVLAALSMPDPLASAAYSTADAELE